MKKDPFLGPYLDILPESIGSKFSTVLSNLMWHSLGTIFKGFQNCLLFPIEEIFPCLLLVRAKNQGSRVGGAKTPSICQKSTFGVITLADVVNPILYGLC